MLWPVLTFIAIIDLVILHLWWRGKFKRAEQASQIEIAKLTQAQQHAASQAQTQQETLFNSMAEGLLLLDEAGRIQLANRAFMKLFDLATNARGKTVMETLRLHELDELVGQLSAAQPVLGQEVKLPGMDERWVQVNAAATFNGDSHRQGTILVFHDLTRLKQLERTRQEFVANVSHELRTPLSLIKGYAETLLDGAQHNPAVASKFLQTIDRNAERLRLLIEDLLTVSELESGRVKLDLKDVPLRAMIEKIFADFYDRAKAKGVTLADETSDLNVRADSGRLEQVLGNLVDNAIKYGRADGVVTIGGRAIDGGQVEIFVQDDGPGIPAEALERIFERFYRVDKARSREQGGTGLGLSIVKHIVQSHGGKVWARSEPGQGAVFYLTLPKV